MLDSLEENENIILTTPGNHTDVSGFHRSRTGQAGSGHFAAIDIFDEPGMIVLEACNRVTQDGVICWSNAIRVITV